MSTSNGSLIDALPNPNDAPYWIVDGRHRRCGAQLAGRTEMRCDVLTKTGQSRGIRVLPIGQLAIDPEVQLDYAYSDTRARKIAMAWDDAKCDALLVVLAADKIPLQRKAELKLAADRERRRVDGCESFRDEVFMGVPRAISIDAVVRASGWKVAKGWRPNYLNGARFLRTLHEQLGEDGLRRTLQLAAHWRGDPKANTSDWLGGCGLLVRDGYDDALTPRGYAKLREVVPVDFIRRAQGMSGGGESSPSASFNDTSVQLAGLMRRAAGLRKRPLAPPLTGKAGGARRPVP